MKKRQKKNNVTSMDEYCRSKMMFHASSTMPHVYAIQIHLQNMEATYGHELVAEVIKNLGLNKPNKKVA